MSRRPKSRSQGDRFYRNGRKRGAEYKAIGIFAIAGLVAAGFVGIAATHVNTDVDNTTGCPSDNRSPEAHTFILVDETDKLNATDLRYTEALIRTEYMNLPLHGRLTVRNILADPNAASEIVVCRMADRAKRGDINANDGKIKRDFQKVAGVRLDRLMDELAAAPVQDASPILESVASVMDRPDFGSMISSRRMIIISDLAQHSDLVSDYGRGRHLSDEARDLLERDMVGVQVRLHYIRRPSLSRVQGPAHKDSWIQQFQHMNVDDVVIGHDINMGEISKREVWTDVS